MERKTFTIRFFVKDRCYKKDGYPFPDFTSIGNMLDNILYIMVDYPEDKWEDRFVNGWCKLSICDKDDKVDYTFYLDDTGCYDQDHNLIIGMKNRDDLMDDKRWRFCATSKDYRDDPLGLAVPESMQNGEALTKELFKSALNMLSKG